MVDIASRVFSVPTVLVSLIDLNRQWFKARVGMDACETALDVSFCRHAVKSKDVMVVLDATADKRFRDNPLVTAPGGIRFYAGAPLRTSDGHTVGTLCLIDEMPRGAFAAEDCLILENMSRLVVELMEGRAQAKQVADAKAKLGDFTSVAVDMFWETDAEHRFSEITVNTGRHDNLATTEQAHAVVASMLGCTRAELEGADRTREPWASHQRVLDRREPFRDFRYTKTIAGRTLHLSVSGKPIHEDGAFVGYRGATHDVTAQEEARLEALRVANVDPLTGLANRRQWNAALAERLERDDDATFCVLILDVDRFKDVNDALGHAAGDQLLVGLGQRLVACAPSASLMARLGGDEFALLVRGGDAVAREVAQCVLDAMTEPVEVNGQPLRIDVSIGIKPVAISRDAHDVMVGADLALRTAKDDGRARWAVFEPAMREETDRRIALVSQFERALEQDEFELHYQPQLRLADDAVVGMEALLRWRHPKRGLLTPYHFLDALEASPFDAPVGRRVIELACRQADRWRREGMPVRVGVNVSSSQLYGDDLVAIISDALSRHALPADAIEVEVTERVALGDLDRVQTVLDGLREIGVSIAFDDFGTGFASLSSLTRFPLDRVKIDRSFVSGVGYDVQNTRLTASLIRMCQGLGLQVIAEGVEEAGHEAFLRLHGCDEVQGYFYSKPVEPKAATRLLRENANCRSHATPLERRALKDLGPDRTFADAR